LARLIKPGKWKGSVKANGQHLSRHAFKEIAAYLPQFDVLVGSQTVYEALYFHIKLKVQDLFFPFCLVPFPLDAKSGILNFLLS
jgi:ABC-type multidrug transport system ATPase subunit